MVSATRRMTTGGPARSSKVRGTNDLRQCLRVTRHFAGVFAFHHDPHDRFGSGRSQQDATATRELALDITDRSRHMGTGGRCSGILAPNVDHGLGQSRHSRGQFRQRLIIVDHCDQNLQRRDDAISGGREL